MTRRPNYTRRGYVMCQFIEDGLRCARQGCWDVGGTELCLTHVRLVKRETRWHRYEAIRIAWPVSGRTR